jgi:hypothetical protein
MVMSIPNHAIPTYQEALGEEPAKRKRLSLARCTTVLSLSAVGFLAVFVCSAQGQGILQNEALQAEFTARGLKAIRDKATRHTIHFANDDFAVFVGEDAIEGDSTKPVVEKAMAHSRAFRFESGSWTVRVVYELKPGWRFVSKQLFVSSDASREFRVHRLEVFRVQVADTIVVQQPVRDGVLLRFAHDGSDKPSHGMFLALQSPFLQLKSQEGRISMAYLPEMDWKPADGPFESERVCFGLYALSGLRYPAAMVPEWKFVPDGARASDATLDMAEVDALVECVRAFLLVRPRKSIRVHVGWCENDYQIDVATPEGRAEYKRIIDQAMALGCDYLLFAPANSELSSLAENRDAWGWENLLWLGLGQKIRKGEWDAEKDSVPLSLQELIDHAKSRGVKLVAYVYPSLPFMQNPEWTRWIKGQPGGYLGADTGQRSFQDWLVNRLVAFEKKTGIGGYSFDHWWIAYDDTPSSKYTQWAGCRRILHNLRLKLPDLVIDGRQQYHQFGVWTWLAGSYPHPLNSDEQPGSFRAFPDLHWDRVSPNRQRYIAWWYRMHCFTPPEILPGYITHQTPRFDAKNVCRRDRYRARDWDYLGWRYSLISSIATAPFNHVVNMTPARDPDEFKNFSAADKKWFRDWLDWTDQNMETLSNVRPFTGHPMVGRVDGTAAFKGEHGFIFLFNPNYRAMEAEFVLDYSIGLTSGKRFAIRQLYPESEKGRLVANPSHVVWNHGDRVVLPMPGAEALVLEVSPAPQRVEQPTLFGAVGCAALADGKLELTEVAGQVGTVRELKVLLPSAQMICSVTINGAKVDFEQTGEVVTVLVRLAGTLFPRCPQIGKYDPQFAGGVYRAEVAIPARVFKQLQERKRQWPIPYTEDDLLSTWVAPERLLLFVNVAEPSDTMKVSLKIDGQPVEVRRAYTSVHAQAVENSLVGWYADVSALKPDTPHLFELELPTLVAGQFQGLFLDNIEAEFTTEIATSGGEKQMPQKLLPLTKRKS